MPTSVFRLGASSISSFTWLYRGMPLQRDCPTEEGLYRRRRLSSDYYSREREKRRGMDLEVT